MCIILKMPFNEIIHLNHHTMIDNMNPMDSIHDMNHTDSIDNMNHTYSIDNMNHTDSTANHHHHINDLSYDDRYRAILSDISYSAPSKCSDTLSYERIEEAINQGGGIPMNIAEAKLRINDVLEGL